MEQLGAKCHIELSADKVAGRRLRNYWAVGISLILGYALMRGVAWQGSTQLHTLMEVAATLLASFVGVMALLRFYSKKSNTFLFIGTGFLGTAFLDGYHAVVTSRFFAPYLPSDLPSLIPWSWIASRQFLSIMLCLSWLAWLREARRGEAGRVRERTVYAAAGVLTLVSFLFFAFVPLPRAYYPELIFHRPEEFAPALMFALALYGYLRKGDWRHDAFEHWLVLALIVGVTAQVGFMSFSGQLFDLEFDAAHLLKKVSYVCVLTGLLISMYATFRHAEERGERLARANEEMHREAAMRKQTEDALAEHAGELARSNADLEEFAYVASHDLKAPLRAIDNLASWIEEDLGDALDGDSSANMERLRGRIARMEALLDDLLQYSRAGRAESPVEAVDTGALVAEIAAMRDNSEAMTVSVIGNMPTFETEKAPLDIVFRNLICNAIKHHDRSHGCIEISAVDRGHCYEFTVADDGPGIAPEFHAKVFMMFQALRPRDEVEATGMGLAIVKKLVERQGGSIEIESETGARGAAFRFQWPKLRPKKVA